MRSIGLRQHCVGALDSGLSLPAPFSSDNFYASLARGTYALIRVLHPGLISTSVQLSPVTPKSYTQHRPHPGTPFRPTGYSR